MQAPKRIPAPAVIGLLLEQPQRFTFTQALNLLLRTLRRQGVSHERAFREIIMFRNTLSLSFPASEVQALTIDAGTADECDALRSGRLVQIEITPAFIGLLGACGTLPLHDTERIAARRLFDADASQHALVDLLSNRLVGMFYEAWGKYRVEHGLDIRGEDTLLPLLTALAGVRPHASRSGSAKHVRQETAGYFSGILRTRPVSANAVERALSAYFATPVRLEQFVGCWDAIPAHQRSTLGAAMPRLGAGAALGTRLWRHDRCARLHIGPLDETQVSGFLPGGNALAALEEMARLFALPTLRYEVRLLLQPACIERFTLSTRGSPRRLGWSTFLTGTAGQASRPDIRSTLDLAGAAARRR